MHNRNPFRFEGLALALLFALGAGAAFSAESAGGGDKPSAADFPAFSKLAGYQLQPANKTLRTGATQSLRVVNCALLEAGPDDPVPLVNACEGIYDGELVSPATVSEWSVNGVVGGNAEVGTIRGSRDQATYTAPARKPDSGTVAISAKIRLEGSLNPTAVANITITDLSRYAGKVTFSSQAGMGGVNITDGVAEMVWVLVEDLPGVRTFTAEGTISGNLAPAIEGMNCQPVHVSGKIGAAQKLLVYSSRSAWNAGTHAFSLYPENTEATLTAQCRAPGGASFPLPFANLLSVSVGGNCLPDMTPKPVPYADAAVLQGSFDCPASDFFAGISAQWTFRAE